MTALEKSQKDQLNKYLNKDLTLSDNDLDEEEVKAIKNAGDGIREYLKMIFINDINKQNSEEEESTNYDQNELYFVKKPPLILKEEDNKTEKVEPIICIEEKDTVSEIISKQGNIHNNFDEIFFDYLFKKLTKQENKSPEDLDKYINDLGKKNIKDEFKEVLGISLENEEYKELLEKTPCEYLDKKIGELPAIINEGKKRNKITECNKKIIKEIYLIFDIYKIVEEKGKNNSSKNIENLYDINVIKDKAEKIFSLEPSDEDKKEIYKKTGKKNRLDNLIRVIITLKKKNENKDKNEAEGGGGKEEKNENKKMDKETNYTYFNSDFSEYVKQYKKEIFKDQIINESEEAKNLIKKKRSEYLYSKVEEKEKRFSFFEKDLDDVIKKYQNSKCRIKTFEFCKSKDIKGLLSILNFVRPAKEKEKLNKVKKKKRINMNL